ncbi:MAG TPA: bacillithiol biosynthesis cysteine-adding enzyme BshC [Gemmatimonadales bacterium]|nr:bacillithiol biosynthesis cysteine-adding enzyme BshC [Gemmatimonadales bacterium]
MSVSLRFLDTPIAPPDWPTPRPGGMAPGLLDGFIAVGGVVPRIDELRSSDLLVVTTGQQPGLFTGPAYTIHKALSARALAARLQARWRRPVVPVFWLAGDDHDLVEASHAAWPAPDGTLHQVRMPDRGPGAPLTPMYREPLPAEASEALARLDQDLAGAEFRAETIGWLARHYHAGATVGGAYAGALAELLAPLGIACFDPTHIAARRVMASLLVRAASDGRAIDAALARRAVDLRGVGRDPGVAVGEGATLVMLEAQAGRDRLVIAPGGYVTRRSGESVSEPQLTTIAKEHPERLSPNVLLRPVVESALLPTVAYVAGPGELRYLALTEPIYAALGVHPQRPVPRWSGIVIEPFVDRLLPKLELSIADVLADGAAVEARLARRHFPPEALETLTALRGSVDASYEVLARLAPSVDPTLVRAMQGLRDRSLFAAEQAERKLIRAFKRKGSDELRQLRRLRTALHPNEAPQERVLTVAPWVARYGPGFLPSLGEAIDRWYGATLEPSPGDR